MKKFKLLFLLSLSAFCVTACDLSQYIQINDSKNQTNQTENGENGSNESGENGSSNENGENGNTGDNGETGEIEVPYVDDGSGEVISEGYYAGIDTTKRGDDLLKQLRDLNKTKRKSTVGYSSMGTTPSGDFKYTDYDPTTVRYDSKGQPYGTKLISFYSGNSAVSGMNREHVWPQSHGGTTVEADIHMPRPTITSENGARGNSFYVEGKKDGTYGWDPAEESFGDPTYRGDSARIIFYCMVANAQFKLVDEEYHATTNANPDYQMGKLSDLLKWNKNYSVLDREQRRNSGAEYLQGNRNPFIDHPEFACKIWGTYNNATKQVCGGN